MSEDLQRFAVYLVKWDTRGTTKVSPDFGAGPLALLRHITCAQIPRMLPRDLPGRLVRDGYAGPREEAAWRGLQMRVMSARRARSYLPGPDEVCVSIRGRGDAPIALQPGWAEILAVECDDTGPYAAATSSARALTREEAREILAFVQRHLHRRRLVLHCHAGVSRSRSVAAAIAEVCGLPYHWTALNADAVAAIRAAAHDPAE